MMLLTPRYICTYNVYFNLTSYENLNLIDILLMVGTRAGGSGCERYSTFPESSGVAPFWVYVKIVANE